MKKLIVILLVGIVMTTSLFAWKEYSFKTTDSIEDAFPSGAIYSRLGDESKSIPALKLIFLPDGVLLLSKSPYTSLIRSEYYIIESSLYVPMRAAEFVLGKLSPVEDDFIKVADVSNTEKYILFEYEDHRDYVEREEN